MDIPSLKIPVTTNDFDISGQYQQSLYGSSIDTKEVIISKKEKKELKADIKKLIKSIRRNEVQKVEKAIGYRDTHPAFKGFIIALIGFGVILASVLINVQTPSVICFLLDS